MRFQGDNDDTTAKGGERAFLNRAAAPCRSGCTRDRQRGHGVVSPSSSDQVLPDCLYCHARVQSLVARAEENVKQCPRKVTLEEVVRSDEKAPDRPELVYSSLPSAKQIPEKRWMSQNGKRPHDAGHDRY